jgi:hypothetical protein
MIKIKLLISLIILLFVQLLRAEVLVGLSALDVTPQNEEMIPLGGYGSSERREWLNFFTKKPHWRMFRPAQGALDPIRSKVMYIERPDQGKKLLFISLDVVGVTKEMHRDLMVRLKDLGFDSASVIISGTHTHSGPGALANNPVWEIMAMDRFQPEYYKKFLGQVIDSVKIAFTKVRPAELYTLTFSTEGLVKNRRGSDRPLDHDANLLLVKSAQNEWLGGMVNFAIHGTSHGASNLYFSSDAPGAIEKGLQDLIREKNGIVRLSDEATFLFVNGAEGDVAPKKHHQELGDFFASQTNAHWEDMQSLDPEWEVVQKEFEIGKPHINIAKCATQKWMPKKINLGLKRWISSKSIITQVRFQNLWFVTWPGEATTELGIKLREELKESGVQNSWILGLSNDHLAYFLTPEEFEKGGYEACCNFFGEHGGLKVIEAHTKLAGSK